MLIQTNTSILNEIDANGYSNDILISLLLRGSGSNKQYIDSHADYIKISSF